MRWGFGGAYIVVFLSIQPGAPPPGEGAAVRRTMVGMIEIKHRTNGKVLLTVDAETLVGADLSGASLRNADLMKMDLGNADLRGADLRGADLRYADMRGSDLRGTNLRGARFHRTSLRHIRWDRHTRWPLFFKVPYT